MHSNRHRIPVDIAVPLLLQYRQEFQLTQGDAARRFGFSASAVENWEERRTLTVPVEVVEQIKGELGMLCRGSEGGE